MGAPFINQKVYAAIRIEAANGTAETTPLSADTALILTQIVPDQGTKKIQQLYQSGRYSELASLVGEAVAGFKFSHDMYLGLGGTTMSPTGIPQADRLLKAMGLARADTTGVTAYTTDPDEDIGHTITIWIFYPNPDQTALAIVLSGVKGKGTLKIASGQPLNLTGDFSGVLASAGLWNDDLPAFELPADLLGCPVVRSGSTQVNGVERSINDLTCVYDYTLTTIQSGAADGGLLYSHITNRAHKVSGKVLADLNDGVEDLWNALNTPGVTLPVVIHTQYLVGADAVAGIQARFEVLIPKLNINKVTRDDVGGDLAVSFDGVALEDEGNDQITLQETFGAVS